MLGICPLRLLHSNFSGTLMSLFIDFLALCHAVLGKQLVAAGITADECTDSHFCVDLTD